MSKPINVEAIAERHYEAVYKYCCAKCREPQDAQDITQEVFMILLQNKDKLYDGRILNWLLNVADIKTKEFFRERSNERSYVSVYDLDEPMDDELWFEEPLEEKPDLDALQKKILKILTEREKELFIKLYVENKQVSLIRKELDLNEEAYRATKSRLSRKLRAFGKDMDFIILVVTFKLFHRMF
jgi:RNA polymerase sigma-70 factor (ECF subfamily)